MRGNPNVLAHDLIVQIVGIVSFAIEVHVVESTDELSLLVASGF